MRTAPSGRWSPLLLVAAAAPLVLLGLLIALFVTTSAGLDLEAPAPIEQLTVERFVLTPGVISAEVRNAGPAELTITQVSVNDSIWPATAAPSNVIPRLGTATIALQYPWVQGEAYRVAFFTANAIVFEGEIPVAFATPQPTARTLASFTLIGVYVGVIPIALGLMWFPALRRLGQGAMVFLLALTAGVLVVLGIDTLAEAFEQASLVAGPLQGLGLVGIGTVGAFLLLAAVSARQQGGELDGQTKRLSISYGISLGIGLHNLGEGLAIGAAYAVGELALASFLVVGFIVQNITEGLAIIAPILRDRPKIRHLLYLGALAGAPAILGTWLGGFSYSAVAATLFLALGAGAIFQVLSEVARLLRRDWAKPSGPQLTAAGVTAGMLLMYLTGLLMK